MLCQHAEDEIDLEGLMKKETLLNRAIDKILNLETYLSHLRILILPQPPFTRKATDHAKPYNLAMKVLITSKSHPNVLRKAPM